MENRRLWTMWWSGIFTLAAFVHLIRAAGRFPLVVSGREVPLWGSWLVVAAAGSAAGWLLRRALAPRWRDTAALIRETDGTMELYDMTDEDEPCDVLRMSYHQVGEDDDEQT